MVPLHQCVTATCTMYLHQWVLPTFLDTRTNHLPCWLGSEAVMWQKGRKGWGVSAHCWRWLVAAAQILVHADISQDTTWHSALCSSAPQQPDGLCSLVKNVHPPIHGNIQKHHEKSKTSYHSTQVQYKFLLSNKLAWTVLHTYLQEDGTMLQNSLFVCNVQSSIFNHNSDTHEKDTSCQLGITLANNSILNEWNNVQYCTLDMKTQEYGHAVSQKQSTRKNLKCRIRHIQNWEELLYTFSSRWDVKYSVLLIQRSSCLCAYHKGM
jgi:hypothetical protein